MNSFASTLVRPEPTRLAAGPETLELMVRQIRCEAEGVNSYELVNPYGRPLPEVSAGAHIDLHLPNGVVRQYSVCNDPSERHRYVIAVLKDEAGRGGSIKLHETLHVRDLVKVGLPRNNFTLEESASRYILLAGGIGVTPLMAMRHRLKAIGADYVLHYCTRTPAHTAFRDEMEADDLTGAVIFHHDNGDHTNGLDLSSLFSECPPGAQVYYCGPAGFMDACARALEHWPEASVHCEHFKAPIAPASPAAEENPQSGADEFDLVIAGSGQTIHVAANQSIVEALADAGVSVDTSCVSGLCGSCKVHYLSGEPDHRDFILSDEEKRSYLTTCVSRCRSGPLVLDL
jgi:ferredoxin-NADP reductase